VRLQIQHRTTYRYTSPASYSIQLLKLTPRREGTQRALWWRLGTPGRSVEQLDAFGNQSHLLTLEGAHDEVVLSVDGVVETDDAFDGRLPVEQGLSPLVFLTPTPLTVSNSAIEALARRVFDGAAVDETAARRLMQCVTEAVRFSPGTTTVTDSAIDVIARGQGVCQDQTHVAIAACRSAGVPARYVSGYLLSEDANPAMHAWMDLWSQAEGCWLSCDVTQRALAGASLVRLAVGRDYLDACPVRGMRRGGGSEELEVRVAVHEATDTAVESMRSRQIQAGQQ